MSRSEIGKITLTNQLLNSARILLVEDEFLIAMDVEQLCRESGAADVRVVANRDELGAALLDDFDADAAILDVKISGAWTVDFARLLRDRDIPFIFATGYSDLEALFDDFSGVPVIGKPYTGMEVIEALAAAMSETRQLSKSG